LALTLVLSQANVDNKICFVGIVFVNQQISVCVSQPDSQSICSTSSQPAGAMFITTASPVLRAVRPLFADVDGLQFEQKLGATGP